MCTTVVVVTDTKKCFYNANIKFTIVSEFNVANIVTKHSLLKRKYYTVIQLYSTQVHGVPSMYTSVMNVVHFSESALLLI